MNFSLTPKLKNVSTITAGFSAMAVELRKLIDAKSVEITNARTAIIQAQEVVEAAYAESEKAERVIKNISALIGEDA